MKKNSGWFYERYRDNKTFLDVVAPVALSGIGFFIGYYIKKSLFMMGFDEVVCSAALTATTALPLTLWNKSTYSFSAKLQQDSDIDKINSKQNELSRSKGEVKRLNKKISELRSWKIKAYQAHKSTAEKIQNLLNREGIDNELRRKINLMLNNGDKDIFKLTVEFDVLDVNDISETSIENTRNGDKVNSQDIPSDPSNIN